MNLSRLSTCAILCILSAFVVPRATAITVCPVSVEKICPGGCLFEVPILVSDFTPLDAVGLDFVLQGDADYVGWQRGNIVRNWQVFDLARFGDRFRLGGFDPTGSASTSADTLAVLQFRVSNPGICVSYRTEGCVDDLAAAAPCEGSADFSVGSGNLTEGVVTIAPHLVPVDCCYTTPDQTNLEVWADIPGQLAVQGAEFRIEVSPPVPGATLIWQPSSGLLSSVGNPIDNSTAADDSTGVTLRFNCRGRINGRFLLGTVLVAGLSEPGEFLVRRHNRPSTAGVSCATFTSCGECSEPICMFTTDTNASDPIVHRARFNSCDGEVCVGIAPRTWTDLKRIYR